MALQSSGEIKMSQINVELGRSATATISLDSAESGTYAAINTNSASYPSDARPAAVSEWYGYDHSASPPVTSYAATIDDQAFPEGFVACDQGNVTISIYKSGTSSIPAAGDTLWLDSSQTSPYLAPQDNMYYKYRDDAGGGGEYFVYLIGNVIEGIPDVCVR